MQLLDFLPNPPKNQISNHLQAALKDIVNRVQIESNFCIRHPDYQALELPNEAVERFQRLPVELQSKYLSQQLQGFLYGIYYNGFLKKALALENTEDHGSLHQDLENNTFLGVDLEYYDKLHQSNLGEGYFDPGWQIIRQEEDHSVAVSKNGLTLHIQPEYHLPLLQQQPEIGNIVAIKLPKNRVQNGFYMAVGNAGASKHRHLEQKDVTVRIYFHLTPDGAVAVMRSLTEQLNQLEIPFSFKALYNPSDYVRYDSAVLYFDRNNYSVVREVLQDIYDQHQTHFRPPVPLFTKLLAPGLAVAEEPDRKFSSQDSFGTNRCQMVANGLLADRSEGNNTPASRMSAIIQQFALLGIELERSYLNANSKDIYTPLEL
jgi:hypothetical protein